MSSRKTGVVCAVRGCHNNWYKRKSFLEQECYDHRPQTRRKCGCKAPYELYPPPKNEETLRLWLKALNLKKPPKRPYVCSFHFVENKPTEDHPVPEKWLGYETPQAGVTVVCPSAWWSPKHPEWSGGGGGRYLTDVRWRGVPL